MEGLNLTTGSTLVNNKVVWGKFGEMKKDYDKLKQKHKELEQKYDELKQKHNDLEQKYDELKQQVQLLLSQNKQ